MTDTLVVDAEGQRIVKGSMVLCGEGNPNRVIYITDPDDDMDDEDLKICPNPGLQATSCSTGTN